MRIGFGCRERALSILVSEREDTGKGGRFAADREQTPPRAAARATMAANEHSVDASKRRVSSFTRHSSPTCTFSTQTNITRLHHPPVSLPSFASPSFVASFRVQINDTQTPKFFIQRASHTHNDTCPPPARPCACCCCCRACATAGCRAPLLRLRLLLLPRLLLLSAPAPPRPRQQEGRRPRDAALVQHQRQ